MGAYELNMTAIGILAYGSLIDDPGVEIEPLIISRIRDVDTPFSIEFARSSSTRDGAPTVIPVHDGGSPVKAQILVLSKELELEQAEDLLWRRETRNEETDKHYSRPVSQSPNRMLVDKIEHWHDLEYVIYTQLGSNIVDLSAEKLADLAIQSAKGCAGNNFKDGISYLISIKKQGIVTSLSSDYEQEILKKTKSVSLEDAYVRARYASK